VEKPPFSEKFELIMFRCKPDAKKKKAPTSVVDGGHRTANGMNPMSTPTSCFTIANPMPIKRSPTDRPPGKPVRAWMVAYLLQGRATNY